MKILIGRIHSPGQIMGSMDLFLCPEFSLNPSGFGVLRNLYRRKKGGSGELHYR